MGKTQENKSAAPGAADSIETLESALKANTAKDNQIKELESQIGESKNVITDLKKQLEEALIVKEDKSAKPVVTVDGVKYAIQHGAHPHSVADIKKDPSLAKEILKITGQKALLKL